MRNIGDGTYSAADAYIRIHRPCHACSQHVHSEPTLIARAIGDLVEAQSVLKGTVLNQRPLRNLCVLVRQAHGEAKVKLWIREEASSTQFDNVAKTFGWTVFAFYSIIRVSGCADEG